MYTHGLTSNVFRQTHVRIARALQRAGYTVVAGNNRGTGLATPLLQRTGPRLLGGSWFDRLENAPIDIGAWMDVAAAGAERLVLLGHSLGGIKALLYATGRRDRRLAGLVLASAPIRSFASGPDRTLIMRAQRALDEGRPQELIETPNPLLFGRTTPETVMSVVAIGDPIRRLRETTFPVLGIFGTDETDIGGQEELDRLGALIRGRFTGMTIARANHLYAGHETEVADRIAAWIRSTVMPSLARDAAPAN